MDVVRIVVGLGMVAVGIVFIVYRHGIVRWSKSAQREAFGRRAVRFQQSQTPNSMIFAGAIGIVFGLIVAATGISRLIS